MLIPICIACGFLIMICSYALVRAWDEVTEDFPIVGTLLVVIAMSIWSCFLGLGIIKQLPKIQLNMFWKIITEVR